MAEPDHFDVKRKELNRFESDEVTRQRAIDHLPLAWQKVRDHLQFACGWSAIRYDAWLWRLLQDEPYWQWLALPYRNFGAPRLLGASILLGAEQPTDEEVMRMAHGQPCQQDCTRGCSA